MLPQGDQETTPSSSAPRPGAVSIGPPSPPAPVLGPPPEGLQLGVSWSRLLKTPPGSSPPSLFLWFAESWPLHPKWVGPRYLSVLAIWVQHVTFGRYFWRKLGGGLLFVAASAFLNWLLGFGSLRKSRERLFRLFVFLGKGTNKTSRTHECWLILTHLTHEVWLRRLGCDVLRRGRRW